MGHDRVQPCLEAQALIEQLGLQPLEPEGGWFRRTWTSDRSLLVNDSLVNDSLVNDSGGAQGAERLLGTAIYFLISAEVFSRIHRVPGPELFHFYQGDPVELFEFRPDAGVERHLLGADIAAGQGHQVLVPGGQWQACRLLEGGRFALLGTTMSPGFADEDFELATAQDMLPWMDSEAELIRQLLASSV